MCPSRGVRHDGYRALRLLEGAEKALGSAGGRAVSDRENVSLRLDLIAAKARQLASDVRTGRLWEGDLARGLSEIREQLQQAEQSARSDR